MTPDRDDQNTNARLENTLESLLPVPEETDAQRTTHTRVDGPIDEVLPAPEHADAATDDASTREELEVDTSADDVDDIVPLNTPEKHS